MWLVLQPPRCPKQWVSGHKEFRLSSVGYVRVFHQGHSQGTLWDEPKRGALRNVGSTKHTGAKMFESEPSSPLLKLSSWVWVQ